MFTKISLSNFKSWKKISDMRLSPITGLFGTNSSGKTSILQSFLLLKQTMDSSDRAMVLEFGDQKTLADLGNFREVVHDHQAKSLDFTISWDSNETLSIKDTENPKKYLLSAKDFTVFSSITEEKNFLSVSKLEYTFSGHSFYLKRKGEDPQKYSLGSDTFHFTRNKGRAWDLPAPVKFYGFPDQVYTYYQNAGFLSDLQLAFEKAFQRIYYLGPLRDFPQRNYFWSGSEPSDMGRRGERVVHAILASRPKGRYISSGPPKPKKSLEEKIAQWLKELGLIHSFSVERVTKGSNLYEVRVQKTAHSANVAITDIGFGVSQVLPILVLCYYVPENSTILLEQPEIHLHPSVQSGLADIFIDVAKNHSVQIIFESHSEHLLRRLQRRIAEEEIASSDASLYFCNILDSGSSIQELSLTEYGEIANWPQDFFGDEIGEIAITTKAMMERQRKGVK
jgi:predicted ATPase